MGDRAGEEEDEAPRRREQVRERARLAVGRRVLRPAVEVHAEVAAVVLGPVRVEVEEAGEEAVVVGLVAVPVAVGHVLGAVGRVDRDHDVARHHELEPARGGVDVVGEARQELEGLLHGRRLGAELRAALVVPDGQERGRAADVARVLGHVAEHARAQLRRVVVVERPGLRRVQAPVDDAVAAAEEVREGRRPADGRPQPRARGLGREGRRGDEHLVPLLAHHAPEDLLEEQPRQVRRDLREVALELAKGPGPLDRAALEDARRRERAAARLRPREVRRGPELGADDEGARPLDALADVHGRRLPARREHVLGRDGLHEELRLRVPALGRHGQQHRPGLAPRAGRDELRLLPLEGLERDLGSTSVMQRRFNVSGPRASVPENTSTLRDRSER